MKFSALGLSEAVMKGISEARSLIRLQTKM